jgi:hypothetical protein
MSVMYYRVCEVVNVTVARYDLHIVTRHVLDTHLIRVYTHTRARSHTRIHTRAHTHARTHARTRTRANTNTHARTHTHIHPHTHATCCRHHLIRVATRSWFGQLDKITTLNLMRRMTTSECNYFHKHTSARTHTRARRHTRASHRHTKPG